MNRENLKMLADYLAQLPESYDRFHMGYFYISPEEVVHDRALSDVANIETSEHLCGSAACAVGHGPAAGIVAHLNEDWVDYSERVFGLSRRDPEWKWAFNGIWSVFDDTPQGAAKRIYWLLEGKPIPQPDPEYVGYDGIEANFNYWDWTPNVESDLQFRVWPDGTTQEIEDGVEPYSWMSDDFEVVSAPDEETAAGQA